MSAQRSLAFLRSWLGPLAAVAVICLAAWLTVEYARAVSVDAADKARVASLQEQARTPPVLFQQTVQPEFDRQRDALQRRVRIYRQGGLSLLGSLGVLFVWLRWIKPAPGGWAGAPAWLEAAFVHRDVVVARTKPLKKKVNPKTAVRAVRTTGGTGLAGASGRLPVGAPDAGASVTPPSIEIRIGMGSCGIANGAEDVAAAIEAAVRASGGRATLKRVGCVGLCQHEPLVEVVENGRSVRYGCLTPADARKLVRRHVASVGFGRRVQETLGDLRARLRDDEAWEAPAGRTIDAGPWFEGQVRVVLGHIGRIDPLSLDDYRRHGGMRALDACAAGMTPADVRQVVRAAGLRGGRGDRLLADDWERVGASAPSPRLVCSGDDGDPKSLTSRTLLEGDPFLVIEGLAVAAHALGAREAVLHVRRADRVAAERVRAAVSAAEQEGLIGERTGARIPLRIEVVEAATAWCGDERTLLPAIDGDRTPTAQPGATLVTDVETMAALPSLLSRTGVSPVGTGVSPVGTGVSPVGPGVSPVTRVLSLAGKIGRGGVIEAPVTTSVRQVVEDIGGGVPGGRPFKAVLAGGPFGVCIPAESADMAIGHVRGNLVVLDEADCIVEIVRRTVRSVQKDFCKSCASCSAELGGMAEILERICKGKAASGDLETLAALARRARDEAPCGPGAAAPTLVLTTLEAFRGEYDAHLDRRCPAATCRSLIHYTVHDTCSGCTLCAQVCPLGAIASRPYERHEIDHNRCTRCGLCVTACPERAIEAV